MAEQALISVIVSTYNRPDALNLVLHAFASQTDQAFELIVADDGSTSATADLVSTFAEKYRSTLDVVHVWQPDEGFQLSAIRNKAILVARGAYLIFVDGDCIPQRDFVARHRSLAQTGMMVTGSRILLSRELTEEVVASTIDLTTQRSFFWLHQRLVKRVNKIMPLYLKLPSTLAWRMKRSFSWKGIKGCNMAAWRQDIDRVGGFDEAFTGWGHEDADFVARLSNAGVVRKMGFCATEVFHLWHREQPRNNANPNYQRVVERLRSGTIHAEHGLPS